MFKAERAYFKTVREMELEAKVAELERALMRSKYGSDRDIAMMPECVEMVRQHAAPEWVKVPRVVSIEAQWDGKSRHLGVAARVTVPEPFGINYYCDAGLLTDNRIAAQVLAINHERFVRQLAEFVQLENAKNETSPNT